MEFRERKKKEKKAYTAERGGLLEVIPKKAAIQTVAVYVSAICMYTCIHTHTHTNVESSSLKNITVNTVGCFILNKKDEFFHCGS